MILAIALAILCAAPAEEKPKFSVAKRLDSAQGFVSETTREMNQMIKSRDIAVATKPDPEDKAEVARKYNKTIATYQEFLTFAQLYVSFLKGESTVPLVEQKLKQAEAACLPFRESLSKMELELKAVQDRFAKEGLEYQKGLVKKAEAACVEAKKQLDEKLSVVSLIGQELVLVKIFDSREKSGEAAKEKNLHMVRHWVNLQIEADKLNKSEKEKDF